ncbi:putative bifunctional diguanylate cyclase/phosphodiesterase [Pseudomonas zhanjiangensis]|uniref:Bifunctional diguanylate cyclase/phosphodiesterase n=1 Tax=Pseudomonas zhanjiangensis TaxID=3239015 RepID=A0ABV3YSB0_9PSED
MHRLRYAFLALVTLGFAVGIGTSLIYNQRNTHIASTRIQISAWSLAQLEFEHQRFVNSLRLYRAGGATREELRLDFELLWSRLEVFLTGEENRPIRQRFNAQALVTELFEQLRGDERLLLGPGLQPGPTIDPLIARYQRYQQPIHQLIINNFTGPQAARIADDLRDNLRLNQILLLGLLFCGGGLSLLLYQEARKNRLMARVDALTNLPNRNSFQARQNSSSPADYRALAVIELSNFRALNEHISHEAGDRLLSRVGETLERLKPKDSFVARMAGDEFVMTFPQAFPEELVLGTLNSLSYALTFDFQNDKHPFQVATRIGLSHNPDSSLDLQQLYYCATLALRELGLKKNKGIEVFSEAISSRYLRSQNLLGDLKRALATPSGSGLCLHYQPIVDLSGARPGVEVLLRWQHPGLGYVPPLEVVELAENNQLGPALGQWVLCQLKQDLLTLPHSLRSSLYFSINISASQFSLSLAEELGQWLADAPILASQLLVEMTESISIANFQDGSKILRQLNDQGIEVALDDFGTGYSSLSYLRELRVQRIKIDKAFIQGIGHNRQLQSVVRSIIELCHTFSFKVTCEGIEDEQDARQVLALGSDHAQGYWYGRPMPLQALVAWHQEQPRRPANTTRPAAISHLAS